MLWKVADFSGVEVTTYCVMSNHFHILVRVPPADTEVSDAELMRRYAVLYPEGAKYAPMPLSSVTFILSEGGEAAEVLRASLLKRMHDVSEFMRTLKLRFSLWYNRTHETYGALWSSRFHAVLVEGVPRVVQAVAAYVDLNPVRAGLVEDPKDYRFCGYAEAVAGAAAARRGICAWMGVGADSDAARMADYRCLLFATGAKARAGRAGIPEAVARRVLQNEEGEVSQYGQLSCKLRYMTMGMVIGSEDFVRSFFGEKRRKPAVYHGGVSLYTLIKPR